MARSLLHSSSATAARARRSVRCPRSDGGPPHQDKRRRSLRTALAVCCFSAALLALAAAAVPAYAVSTLNLQARDGSIVLKDLGKGKAAFSSLTTDGNRARNVQLWQGKLPVAMTRYMAGDLNADQYTDVAALVRLPRGRTKLLFFVSTGKKLKQTAIWSGRLDWASARLSVGFFVPDQTRDLAITSKGAGGGTQITLFRLLGKKILRQPLALVPAGTVPSGAAMTSGDVNGDFHDELVFFGPGASASTGRLVALVNNNGLWQAQKTWEGPALVKGAQVSCGDVDGDGIAEAVALTSDGGGTVTTFDCDGPQVVASASGARAAGIPSAACRFSVTDMTGDEYADLVTLQRKGSTRITLVVSASQGKSFTARTYWTGKGTYGACRLSCTRTLPTVKRDDVHTLSVETAIAIVSAGEDGVVTFAGTPSEVTSLEQGDIILVEPLDPVVPLGLMRTVESVVVEGDQTIVQTTTANLEDVFVQAEVDVRAPVSTAQGGVEKRAGRSRSPARGLTLELAVPFDDVTLIEDPLFGNKAVLDGELKLGLTIDCWVRVTVKWKYGFIPIPTIRGRVAVTFSEETSLTLTMTGTLGKEFDKDFPVPYLKDKLKTIKFMVGPVPVWIKPQCTIGVYGEVRVKAEAKISAQQRAWATLGVEYDGGWKNLCDAGVKLPKPTLSASRQADLKLGLMVKTAGLIYGVFGPYMGEGAFVRFMYVAENNPKWLGWAGMDIDLGARLELPKGSKEKPTSPWLKWLADDDYGFGPITLFQFLFFEGPIDEDKPRVITVYTVCGADLGADPPWYNAPATVQFEGVSYGTKLKETEYRLDGSKWKSLISPVEALLGKRKASLTVSGEGEHKLDFRSIAVGGETESVRTALIRIDRTAPTVSVTGADPVGQAGWRGAPVTLRIAAADKSGGSGVLKSSLYVDGEPQRFPGGTGEYVLEKEGLTRLSWDAQDKARLTSATGQGELKLDLKPPVTTVTGADDAWHSEPVTLTFSATDVHDGIAGSGVARTEYRIARRGVFGAWTVGTSVTVSETGDRTVEFRSTDNVGHVEEAQTVHVKVDTANDTVAPTTTVSPDLTGWKMSNVTLTFTPTDPAPSSGIDYTEYKVGAGEWIEGTSVVVSTEGATTVQYRSTDLHGNAETAKTAVVRLDKTLPAVSVSPATGVFDEPVTLTFSASDALSGVARIEYKVDDKSTTADDSAPFTTGTSVTLPAPAGKLTTYVVRYRTVDNAGNVRQPADVTIRTDTRKLTWVVTGDDEKWHNTPVVLTFSATTPSGADRPTQYLVDGDPDDPSAVWTPGSAVTVAAPSNHSNDGLHQVYCRASDEFGDVETSQYEVKIDTTAPVTTWGTDPSVDLAFWNNKPVDLSFTAQDLPGRAGAQTSGVTKLQLRDTGGLEWVKSADLPSGTPVIRDAAVGTHYVGGVALGQRIWAATNEWSSLSYSDDLGMSWSTKDLGLTMSVGAVECPTATTVWVANGSIDTWAARSTDGGGTWTASAIPGYVEVVGPLACQSGNADKAWVAGKLDGSWGIWATVDGGATWTPGAISGDPIGAIKGLTCAPDGLSLWAAGDAGLVLHSSDGGATWSRQSSPLANSIHDVVCSSDQVAWAFGDSGEAVWTRDGGATWTVMGCRWPAGADAGLVRVAPTSDTTLVGLTWRLGEPVAYGHYDDGDGIWDMTLAGSDRIYGVSPHDNAGILVGAGGVGIAWDGQLGNVVVDRNDTEGAWVDKDPAAVQTRFDAVHSVSRDGAITVDFRAVDDAGNVETPASPAPVVKIDTIVPLTLYWGLDAADNPGGSGLADISVRATQTRWGEPTHAEYADSPGNPMVFDLTCVEYADARHGVAGWQYQTYNVGTVVTSDGGTTWTARTRDLVGGSYAPEMIDVTAAWADPSLYVADAIEQNVGDGDPVYQTRDLVTLTDWQASTATLIDSWVCGRPNRASSRPLPRWRGSPVRRTTRTTRGPSATSASGTSPGTRPSGVDQVPLGDDLTDVTACSVTSGARLGCRHLRVGVRARGELGEPGVVDGRGGRSLVSVDSGVMADGSLHIWAVGPSLIVHSGDGGETWSQTTVPPVTVFRGVDRESLGVRAGRQGVGVAHDHGRRRVLVRLGGGT